MTSKRFWLASSLLALASSFSQADTLWISSTGSGSGTENKGVKVQKVEGDTITYLVNGNQVERPLTNVMRFALDDEPALTEAENQFMIGKMDQAADLYQKALRASNKPWVKDRAAVRLIEASNKTGRFDAAVTGYLHLVTRDPNRAMQNKPVLPDAKSNFIALGLKDLDKALEQKVSPEQEQAILTLKLDLLRVSGDQAGSAKVVERLTQLNPAAAGNGGDNSGGNSTVQISIAQLALDQKDYKKALDTIEASLASFTEPRTQADALWIKAEAEYAILGEQYDKTRLQDCALNYMRVVALFQSQAGAPHVAESLYKTGEILERLSEPREALRCYEDVAKQYANSNVGPKAQAAVQRLKNPPQ